MAASEAEAGRLRVWDPVVRILHWTLAASFLGAFVLDGPRDLHEALGYGAAAAVAVRLVWGVVGPRHARFRDFVPSPGTLARYVRDAIHGRERRYLGHNPAGGAMVVALLTVVGLLGVTGWMMSLDAFWGDSWLQALHETLADLAIALVALHVGGVVWESWRHRENLVGAMITGTKRR